jgi:hypothetical protein
LPVSLDQTRFGRRESSTALIDHWSLGICNWQWSSWGSGTQLQVTDFNGPWSMAFADALSGATSIIFE